MTGRARDRARPLATALLLWLALAAEGAAQVSVIPVSELRFGTLTAGIPTRIAPGDATGSAQIDVTAAGRITVVVALPAALQSPGGAQVAVQFGATDGLYQVGNGQQRAFDPRSPLDVLVPPGRDKLLRVWIGGTALPTPTQVPGSYSGMITLQVYPGG